MKVTIACQTLFLSALISCCAPIAHSPRTRCVDELAAQAIIDPTLSSSFFQSKAASYPFHIIEHEDGHLEDTLGGTVSSKDITKMEHTAKCISTHQGVHEMSFCDAEWRGHSLRLLISGGMPAYASSLQLDIDQNLQFIAAFQATYPMESGTLTWRITKKSLHLKSNSFEVGTRLHAWISIEFEEITKLNGKTHRRPYKIEGYLKPLIKPPQPEAKRFN